LKIFKIKVGVIITDESSLPLQGEMKLKSFLKKIDSFFIQRMVSKFDFGMALSDGLSDRYFQEVNFLNFPGIVDNNFYTNYNKNEMVREDDSIFKVYYAGIISSEYGMNKLIDAILLIDWPIQLCCYGKGDQSKRLAKLSKNDSRFFYGGFVSEYELIGAMKNSDLLINARPSNTRLAKMSFPSKLLEYASTGKAVLTTKLPSIPSNIAEGFFYIGDESAEGIAKAIELVEKVGRKKSLVQGHALRKSVLDNYSDVNLAKYVSEFLSENM
jgi:glycosyltransferase involved in cell wall biosynthesis